MKEKNVFHQSQNFEFLKDTVKKNKRTVRTYTS